MNKLQICKRTRKIASESLYIAFDSLLKNKKQISEVDLRDAWLAEMQKHESIFPEGWYIPPPHGISVLFGTDSQGSRVSYNSLRPEKIWPRNDVFLNEQNTLAYVYTSPVDKISGIIGDFGMTLYFGSNEQVKNHIQLCLTLNKEIYDFVEVGKTFADIYVFAQDRFNHYGFHNEVISTTDTASVNIGHTIPFSYEDTTDEEQKILDIGDCEAIATMISRKRRFVNAIETFPITSGMAFTIEPRPTVLNHPEIPMASFHTIVAIK